MAEQTPGPWELRTTGDVLQVRAALPPHDIICEPLVQWSDATLSWEPLDSAAEWEAKAKVIAAAPDLLAACAYCLDMLSQECGGEQTVGSRIAGVGGLYATTLLRTAIAKATGQTSPERAS